jgi:RNA polymerase-binding transcription factor DksA
MQKGKRNPQNKPRTKPSKRVRKASTADVLGNRITNTDVPHKWKKHFRMLTTLREHLRSQKGDLMKDALEERTSIQREMADVGTNSYDRDWALSMISSEQNALYEIEQALNRIKNGTYGKCEITGKAIPAARLDAIPWTRFTAAAEAELEKRGELDRPKLGNAERVSLAPERTEREEE